VKASTPRVLVLGALLALAPGSSAQAGETPRLLRMDQVRVAPALHAAPPPPDSPEWREIRLPHDWEPLGGGTPVWCLAQFWLDAIPDHPLEILVPQAGYGAEIVLNGRSLGAHGLPPDAIWGRREPVAAPLPGWLLARGRNELALRVTVRPEFAGYLTPIWIGAPEALERRLAIPLALLRLADFLALLALGLSAALWVAYRGERRAHWLWLAIAFLLLGLAGLPWRAIDYSVWSLGVAGGACCIAAAMHRVEGLDRRRLEVGLIAPVGLLAVLAFALPAWRLPIAGAAAGLGGLVTGYVLVLYRGRSVAEFLTRPGLLLAAVASSLVISANDWPLFWNRSPWLGIPLFPVAHVFVLLASAYQLVLFLSTRLSEVRSVNRELEESRDRVVALEREQATRSERLRLQRELHDGLGAQLVGALAIAERQGSEVSQLPDALRGALGELRVAVDSLDAEERELVEVLGSLRARLEPLVQGSGIEFSWRVEDVASARRVPPEHAIHLLRMLQEAIANAVKHAAPRRIEVRSGAAPRDGVRVPFVEVQDDGRGFTAPAAGRGLENMRRRAELIGGSLEVVSDAGSTRVRLWLAPAAC
jgi:signal transduction histidine kinase